MGRFSVLIPDVDDDLISIPVAQCLTDAEEIDIHGLSRHKSRSLQLSNLFTSFDQMDEFALSGWLRRIDEVVARRRIDIVLPVTDVAIRALSEHRHVLACAGKVARLPEPSVFDVATNKASLALFMKDHDIPHPPTVVLAAGARRSERLSTLAFPVLAKPPFLSGGDGIRRFENAEDLDSFLSRQMKEQEWIIQEFIPGVDIDVNVLCKDGQIVASTVQHAIASSSTPFSPAIGIEFKYDSVAMDIVKRLIEQLGWSGIAHIDMRLDARTKIPLVLEINGRYWLTLLGSLRAGVNFPLLACEATLGPSASSLQAQTTRYFRGNNSIALSLCGGGRHRIRPSETDLKYFIRDPKLYTSLLITTWIKVYSSRLSGHLRALKQVLTGPRRSNGQVET
ncbi:MAG TPA: ATP-grasp domain-containing protein [Terracidiphilus sp.]|jgi:predicted ATP-grasp superfamily ATP-dependent carboligase